MRPLRIDNGRIVPMWTADHVAWSLARRMTETVGMAETVRIYRSNVRRLMAVRAPQNFALREDR